MLGNYVGYNAGGQITLNMPGLESFETDISNMQGSIDQVSTNKDDITAIKTFTGYDANYTGNSVKTRLDNLETATEHVDNVETFTGWTQGYSGDSLLTRIGNAESSIITADGEIGDLENYTGYTPSYTGSDLNTRITNAETALTALDAPSIYTLIDSREALTGKIYRLPRKRVHVMNIDSMAYDIHAGAIPNLQDNEWSDGDILEIALLRRRNGSEHRFQLFFNNKSGLNIDGTGNISTYHSRPVFCNFSLGGSRGLGSVGSGKNWKAVIDSYTPSIENDGSHAYYRFVVWKFQMPSEMVSAARGAYVGTILQTDPLYLEDAQGNSRECIAFLLESRI